MNNICVKDNNLAPLTQPALARFEASDRVNDVKHVQTVKQKYSLSQMQLKKSKSACQYDSKTSKCLSI